LIPGFHGLYCNLTQMRTAFIKQLIEEARRNDKIFLIVGDLGFSVIEPFASEFPDRFLNAGVAEQNMIGIASGLAKEGYNAFVYSIANFPTLRCMEQIRYDVCYHNRNVKIVAVGSGYSYGSLGPSHHATEELGMLRILPNISIASPADPRETEIITRLFSYHSGPAYLRLGKAGEPMVHNDSLKITWGEIIPVIEGNETAVLALGSMLKYSFDYIKVNKLNWGLYSVPFIKPFDKDGLIKISNHYERIITIEEHQKNCGLGSVVAENLIDLAYEGKILRMPRTQRIAINDIFLHSAGSQDYLRMMAGLFLNP
jgi:transketolase